MSNVSIDREKLKALLRAGNDLLLWSYSDNPSEESKEVTTPNAKAVGHLRFGYRCIVAPMQVCLEQHSGRGLVVGRNTDKYRSGY